MDHSVLAYINRLSTQRLEEFLEQFYQGAYIEDFSTYVPYIVSVLERRKKEDNCKKENFSS